MAKREQPDREAIQSRIDATRTDRMWWAPWLTIGVAVLVYVNSLPGDFVFDDKKIVGQADPRTGKWAPPPRLSEPAKWHLIWTTHYWQTEGEKPWEHRDLLYRPLTLQTYAINYVFGNGAWHFHAVNVALYGLVCLGIWQLGRRIFDSAVAATAGTLLFAVHPLHTEVVANLVGRSELLAGGFLTAALLCWHRDGQRPALRWAALGLLCAVGAVFSKESGLMLVPAAVLLDWWWRSKSPDGRRRPLWTSRLVRCYLPLLLIVMVYMLARYYACGERLRLPPIGALDNPLTEADAVGRILGPFKVLGKYLSLFVFPMTLSADYSFNSFPPPNSPFEPLAMLGIVAAIAGVVGAVASWRGKREWVLLLGLFAFPYLLVSNTVILIGTIFGERLFFWPSMPLCLLAGRLAERLFDRAGRGAGPGDRRRRMLKWAGVAALVVLAGRSMWRNFVWSGDHYLTLASRQVQPDSAKVRMGYAGYLHKEAGKAFDKGEVRSALDFMGQARPEFEEAVRIHPEYSQSWLGIAQTGGAFLPDWGYKLAKHKWWSENAVGPNGNLPPIDSLLDDGRKWAAELTDEQRALLEEAAALMQAYRQLFGDLNPQSESLYHLLRSVLDHGQFIELRIWSAQQALAVDPRLADSSRNSIQTLLENARDGAAVLQFGMLQLEAGRPDIAVPFLQRAVRSFPTGREMARLRDRGEWVLGPFPTPEEAAVAFGKALTTRGRMGQASEVFTGVLKNNYRNWRAHMHLGLLLIGENPDSACKHGRLAAEMAPNDLLAQAAYARILDKTGRYDEAIRQYQSLLKRGPELEFRTRLIKWRIEKLKRKAR